MFCRSPGFRAQLDPYEILSQSPKRSLSWYSRDHKASSVQNKTHWISRSYRRLINWKPANDLPCLPAENTIDIPCNTAFSSTTRSHSARKMAAWTRISPIEGKPPPLSKANTLPNSTAPKNVSSNSISTTLSACQKRLCVRANKWVHGCTRTVETPRDTASDGQLRTADLNDSPSTTEPVYKKHAFPYPDRLFKPKTIVTLQEELMLLFYDAKKWGFVVEAGQATS